MCPFDILCSKVNLRLALSRLRLQSTKKRANLKPQRREIGKLLGEGKEVTARALTEQLIREERALEAYAQLELFVEQFLARFDAVAREPGMPKDLVVCLCSLVFAAPRVDVEELKKVASNLELRYGTLWVDASHSNLHQQVHEKIHSNLSIGRPEAALVDRHMIDIAKENEIDWSPLVATPSEQDLAATYQAAKRLTESNIKAPQPINATRQDASQNRGALPSAQRSHVETSSRTIVDTDSENAKHSFSSRSSANENQHIERISIPVVDDPPTAPCASPPLEYVRLHSFNQSARSTVEEELIMIDMLPCVPSNLAISMSSVLQGNEGGIVTTHEHDDGEVDIIENPDTEVTISDSDIYEAILDCDEIPDGPVWEESDDYSQDVSTSYINHASSIQLQVKEEEDPLLARMRRLKNL